MIGFELKGTSHKSKQLNEPNQIANCIVIVDLLALRLIVIKGN